MGWNNSVFPLLIITSSGGFTGLFVYSPGPGNGNLVASITGHAGTDPYGNNFNAGISSYSGLNTAILTGAALQFFAGITNRATISTSHFTVFNSSGATIYDVDLARAAQFLYHDTGSATQGALVASEAQASGTDQFGNAYQAGVTSYQAGSFVQLFATTLAFFQSGNLTNPALSQGPGTLVASSGTISGSTVVAKLSLVPGTTGGVATADLSGAALLIENTALPAANAAGPQASGSGGQLAVTNPQGLTGTVQVAQSDLTAFTVTAATFTQFSKAWSIPAADMVAGATYRIRVWGAGTQGSTQQALTIALQIGGTNVGGTSNGATFAPASTAFSFYAELELTCVTTGAAGTAQASKAAFAGTQQALNDTGATPVTVNTTIANTFEAVASWGSTTGAPTVTCRRSIFERVV